MTDILRGCHILQLILENFRLFRGVARIKKKYLKLSRKFLTLMTPQLMSTYKATSQRKKTKQEHYDSVHSVLFPVHGYASMLALYYLTKSSRRTFSRFRKTSKCPVWYSMLISSHMHNAANRAIAKNS